jgi:predicted ATPase
MLHAVRLRNFRSYVDTGDVELAKLNVFIGPNNAGKTSLVSAIELFLRTLKAAPRQDPLVFDEMSAFASFDSVLRRHWSPGEQRPQELSFGYRWSYGDSEPAQYEYTCRRQPQDNTSHNPRTTRPKSRASTTAARKYAFVLIANLYLRAARNMSSLSVRRNSLKNACTFRAAYHFQLGVGARYLLT